MKNINRQIHSFDRKASGTPIQITNNAAPESRGEKISPEQMTSADDDYLHKTLNTPGI
jgi:hypothetical protein